MENLKGLENLPDSLFNEINDINEQEFADNLGAGGGEFKEQAQSFEQETITEQQPNNSPNMGFLDSTIVIGVIDSLLPAIIVWSYQTLAAKKVNKSSFVLSAAEKKTLDPILKACLETIDIDMSNPWKALLITAGMIYGGKVMTAESEPLPVKMQDIEQQERRKRGRPRINN